MNIDIDYIKGVIDTMTSDQLLAMYDLFTCPNLDEVDEIIGHIYRSRDELVAEIHHD